MSPPDAHFWTERWAEGRTAFHQPDKNALLVAHLDRLPKGRVLVPLCGKSHDLAYLRDHERPPFGVEVVEQAVRELFEALGVSPTREGDLVRGAGVSVFLGDFFAPTLPALAGTFDGVWDRAALVAIDPSAREPYRDRLLTLMSHGGTLLLATFDYDQDLRAGPPFSVPDDVVHGLFGPHGTVERVAQHAGTLPTPDGTAPVMENVYVFVKR